MHSSYTAVSIVCSLRSLYLYRIPCMIRRVILVLQYWFHYLNVCSSTMFVDLKGQGSAQSTGVSPINAGMLFGFVKCCWMSLHPMIFRDSQQVMTSLSVLRNPLHRVEEHGVHRVAELVGSSTNHVRFSR